MQYGFYFDQTRCIGCNACTVSCKDYHQVNPGIVRWRHQENHEKTTNVFENLTMSCNHCSDPACMKACYFGAIKKRDNGIVYVDRTLCQGLEACIEACPFSATHIADDKQEPNKKENWMIAHPMQKCKYCYERVEAGQGAPVCVAACPVRALDWGDVADIQAKYPEAQRISPTIAPYAYKNTTGPDTKPNFFIKKRKHGSGMQVKKLVK